MAIIKKDITLNSIIKNIHQHDYALYLTDHAKDFLMSRNLGNDKDLEVLKEFIETFVGKGDEFNIKAKEWGFDESVDESKMVIAAFSQFLSEWATPGEACTITTTDVNQRNKLVTKEHEGFSLTCGVRTSHNDVFSIRTKSDEFSVFLTMNKKLNMDSDFLNAIELKNACDLKIPNIDAEIEDDFSEYFSGSQAVIGSEIYDIDEAVTKAKIKLNKNGVEIKQMSKMTLVMSGCLTISVPIEFTDDFSVVVSKKTEDGHFVLFDILIEKSDFIEK